MTKKAKDKQKKLDKAVDMTFPASDPVATGKATGTEPPKRPADRKAPIITKEEIERARRGSGLDDNRNERSITRKASPRELIAPRGDKRYIRRDERGRIKESDDVGRSHSQDRRRKAKTVAKGGQGDRGDRARR